MKMAIEQSTSQVGAEGAALDAEVLIIGAGVTGIHQLYLLREAGYDVRLIEAGTNVGGTWYWNRYPGARFDSESYSYGYFFSPEILEEWKWSEHFAGQAETEAYVNFAADKLGLRDLMQFGTRIASATFDEASGTWTLTTEEGTQLRSRFVVSATGVLSVPYWPSIPGRERYQGEAHHTGQWPKEPVEFAGKRVAVIGSGASAVQLIPEIAKEVGELVVFQRTPNWNSPLNNGKITDEEQAEIQATHDEIYQSCMNSFAGFVHGANRKRTFDDSKEERWVLYEKLYHQKGFSKLISNYRDMMTNSEANAEFSEFVAEKIRARVNDPAVAEKLIPSDHGYGMRRPPMETRYFEAYNQDNVELVDLNETPIVTITEAGIETTAGESEFDIIVWATGFDGFTGALTRMDVVGEGGVVLRDQWAQGVSTYLGAMCSGFPNFFMAGGPHLIAGNFPRATEIMVDYITGVLNHAKANGGTYITPEDEACAEWTEEVHEAAKIALIAEKSWFRGANIPGKANEFLPYAGSLTKFRQRMLAMEEQGYPGITFGTPVRT
ncbi:MAG: cation diffusion facilitator CzcD-associated flavoprotein CzcO [Acidimicrobiales bacterium]|jgi:cation diffusion facilitator CzcD-associated flavoprotein CzcO